MSQILFVPTGYKLKDGIQLNYLAENFEQIIYAIIIWSKCCRKIDLANSFFYYYFICC